MAYALHQVPNHASGTFAFRHPPARTAAAGCSSSNVTSKLKGALPAVAFCSGSATHSALVHSTDAHSAHNRYILAHARELGRMRLAQALGPHDAQPSSAAAHVKHTRAFGPPLFESTAFELAAPRSIEPDTAASNSRSHPSSVVYNAQACGSTRARSEQRSVRVSRGGSG